MMTNKTTTPGTGIGICGSVIAIMLSWAANKSILWAVVHGALGWLYVLYRVGGCGGAL